MEDREFSVYCELEELDQLYHGAIIGIHTKQKQNHLDSVCNYNTTITGEQDQEEQDEEEQEDEEESVQSATELIGTLIKTELKLNTTQQQQQQKEQEKEEEKQEIFNKQQQPSYAQIVQQSTKVTNTANTTNTTTNTSSRCNSRPLTPPQQHDNNNNNNNNNDDEEDEDKYEYAQIEENEEYKNYIIPKDKYYLLLTGVPFNATKKDIILFFNDLEIYKPFEYGIYFVINYKKHRIGHVYVIFNNKYDYNLGLKKDGHYIGDRYINVLEGDLIEFKKNVKIGFGINMKIIINDNIDNNFHYLKLKGFSFGITEFGINEWLKKEFIFPISIYIIYDYRNRNSGISFLKFKYETEIENVFKRINNKYLGIRYINVNLSNINELKLSLTQMIGSPLPQNLNPYLNCLRMEGISSYFKYKDIFKFFDQTLGITPKQLILKDKLGIAYIEFKNQFQCQLALTKHETYIYFKNKKNKKYKKITLHLFSCSKYELRSIINSDHRDIVTLNEITNNTDFKYEFKNYHNAITQIDDNNNNNNNQYQYDECNQHLISIRGIPFNATKQEIIDFFWNYDSMDPKSLRLIMDHRGRFSGQATVAFFNRHQARSAVKNLDRNYIGNRYVLLRLF